MLVFTSSPLVDADPRRLPLTAAGLKETASANQRHAEHRR
jgi:hypothetical protein